jgi:hypothetical protein
MRQHRGLAVAIGKWHERRGPSIDPRTQRAGRPMNIFVRYDDVTFLRDIDED